MHPPRNVCILSIFAAMLAAIIILAGCSPRKLMVSEFAGVIRTGLPAVEQEGDLQLLAQSMPAHIKLLETLLASDPHNRDLHRALQRRDTFNPYLPDQLRFSLCNEYGRQAQIVGS